MNSLINQLIRKGYLKTDSIIEAFSDVNRIDFLPPDLEAQAQSDIALPIGYGQTISQSATVAIMLELLDAKSGQNVLDVGSGSGWTTALLCHIVGPAGKVTAVERIRELMKWGRENVGKYGYLKEGEKGIAEFHQAEDGVGFEKNVPYDRILVSAGAEKMSEVLKSQLKIGGKMVIPVGNNLVYVERKSEDDFYEKEQPGFVFVPLIHDKE